MESPTGIIPEFLMDKSLKGQVLDYLRAQPWAADFKLQVLAGWGQVTGSIINADDQASVHASGWDAINTGRK